MSEFKILCLGDVVGEDAVARLKQELPRIIKENNVHCTVINGENALMETALAPTLPTHSFLRVQILLRVETIPLPHPAFIPCLTTSDVFFALQIILQNVPEQDTPSRTATVFAFLL